MSTLSLHRQVALWAAWAQRDRRAAGLLVALAALTAIGAATVVRAGCDAGQAASTPSSRFLVKAGEVYDKKTGLTWQRCSVGQRWKAGLGCVGVILQMTWKEAQLRETALWRLPTRDELASLIATNCSNPAINETVFPDMELPKLWYWTSTESGGSVLYVAFGGGSVRESGPSDLDAVRLVKK